VSDFDVTTARGDRTQQVAVYRVLYANGQQQRVTVAYEGEYDAKVFDEALTAARERNPSPVLSLQFHKVEKRLPPPEQP
jgi:hypothetical protein